MYFTNTPSLNSMEAIMQRPPGGNQRGGGRIRRAYQFNKADCDCRLCLYHRKKKGCSMEICPVLDARLTCGAASFYEAIHAAFADARHTPFQRRLSHLYDRKDDAPIIFQTDQHRQRFEAQKLYLRKPDHRSLAVLYLLTADHTLWSKTRRYMPDVEMLSLLSKEFGVSINELISGERLWAEDFKKAADDNLVTALNNSTFTLKEKIVFFKKKWLHEHISTIVLCVVAWIGIIIWTALKLRGSDSYALLGAIGSMLAILFYVVLYNRMMVYVENHAYRATPDKETETKN